MPLYLTLRIQRDRKAGANSSANTEIGFFPILIPGQGYHTIESDCPENALAEARRRFPYLGHALAVENTTCPEWMK